MQFKSTHRIIRALLARFLCLLHIALSIFVLYSAKKDLIYLIPIVGALLLLVETLVVIFCFKGREPTPCLSTLFLVYVVTIVACYWFLELENIRKMIVGQLKRTYQFTFDELISGDIATTIKVIWSQVELQIFFALIMFCRWIIPKSSLSPHGLAELLFKYFAISCDMLDFLTILSDSVLINHEKLVYWTLSVWSWSTIQFFIFVPKYDDEEKREFNAYITNSLLSTIFMDLPYLGVRVTAIFLFGSHNYNSYFFASKNLVMILLQIVRIQATLLERKIRQNKAASKLKEAAGFDKESEKKLFDPNHEAIRSYLVNKVQAKQAISKMTTKSSKEAISSTPNMIHVELSKPMSQQVLTDPAAAVIRVPATRPPRTLETVKNIKRNPLNNLSPIKAAHHSSSEEREASSSGSNQIELDSTSIASIENELKNNGNRQPRQNNPNQNGLMRSALQKQTAV